MRVFAPAGCLHGAVHSRSVESRRPALLLVVDDPGVLDLLTRVFERRGFTVATSAVARQAITSLESGRVLDVVVAAWDPRHAIGGEVYRWVLKNRVGMRANSAAGPVIVQPVASLIAALPPV